MAQGLYVSGDRTTYTPREFGTRGPSQYSPAAPRLKTKLVCGKIVKVLDDDETSAGVSGRGGNVGGQVRHNYTNKSELLAPYHTQPSTLSQYPRLPPIEPAHPHPHTDTGTRYGADLDQLYRHLPADGSFPDNRIQMTDEEVKLLRYHLKQHLHNIGSDRILDVYENLQSQRKHHVPVDDVQDALTRNMILIPPQLLKLSAALFASNAQPGSVEIAQFIQFLTDSTRSPRKQAEDSWTKFPAELVPVLKMLPRHSPVPYECILLRTNERSALLGHLHENLQDVEPATLKEIYHELSLKDREMNGCVSYDHVKDAFESRSTRSMIMPIILRLLCSMHVSRRHLGQIEFRPLLRLIEESLGTHFSPGPPALNLPPAPPRELTHLLRQLPRNTDLPNDSLLLREADKALVIKHVRALMSQVSDEEMRSLHLDLSHCDRSMNGAVRYQDLSSVFMSKKINFSPEILRLLACMFISARCPGHVDYKKFMMFLSGTQKGMSVDVTAVLRESSTLDGLPNPPVTILPVLRELPKQPDQLPPEPLSLTKDEQQDVLTYVENHLYEFDPIAIESMYNRMEELDRDGRRYIHYSIIREEVLQKRLPLHPMMVRLISSMFVAPNTDNCVRYGRFLAFIGMALKRMPRIPDLVDTAQPALKPSVLALLKLLPRHGLPDRALDMTERERNEVRAQLAELLANVDPDQVMGMLDDFIIMDKKGSGVLSLEMIKRILGRAQVSLPERFIDLIAAMFVSQYYPEQVDFKEFLAFLDSVVSDGKIARPYRGHTDPPDSLKPLIKLVDDHSNLPHQPLAPNEYQRVQLSKYLNQVLVDVTAHDLNKLYDDLVKSDMYHDGAVPAHIIQSMLLKHRVPIHKDIVKVLSAMFVQAKQMPHQVVDIKRLLMCLSSALKDAGPIDGDMPQGITPGVSGVPPLPAVLMKAHRSLPADDELPNSALILSESEKACLQEHLSALSPKFSSENFKTLYLRMAETDRFNSGSLSFKDVETVMKQFGWSLPHDALKLVLAMFVMDKTHGRVDYSKLIVFLNSTLNLSSTKDLIELTKNDTLPPTEPETVRKPEMEAMFRLLPPYYQLPLEPVTLTENEKEILLDDIRRNVWPLDKNSLKILYQQLSTMDSKQLNYLPFEDIKQLFRTKGVTIDPDVLRVICSQYVSVRMKGYVNYEDLINFLNEAMKSPKMLPTSDEPIGVRVDLPPPLVHVVSLLPDRQPLPSAPLFLKESERTMLAEAIHDALIDVSENNVTQLHAEYVRLDTNQIRTLGYADILQGFHKFNIALPIDVSRLLMAQFVRDEGRVEYRGVIEFLKAAIRYIPDLPSSRAGYQSNRDLPPPRIHQGKIRPLHGRNDVALIRQINRILIENNFNADLLRDAFTSADVRRNGTLSAVQIREISKRHRAPFGDHIFDMIFEHLDYMGLGQLSWSQFVEFLQRCLDRGLD